VKVGILTFHKANNYGAVLQAYALQETIRSMGHEVEIIDYKQEHISKKYRKIRINFSGFAPFIRSIASTIIHFRNLSIIGNNFNSFRKENLLISKESYDNLDKIYGYDAYISGSDQVWNLKLTGYDKSFFLDFNNKGKKVSYAASLGQDRISIEDKEFIRKYIDNFDSISVREASAQNILSSLTTKKITRVLDPTLLTDKQVWNKFLTVNKYGEYILVYSVGQLNNIIRIAHETSEILDTKILFLTARRIQANLKQKHIHMKVICPSEFLTLLYNAKFIVTNSFHGTAFSVIFNKNFITIPHKETGARMIEMLQLLNLKNRIITNENGVDNIIKNEIDYRLPNEILNNEKTESHDFLKKALS